MLSKLGQSHSSGPEASALQRISGFRDKFGVQIALTAVMLAHNNSNQNTPSWPRSGRNSHGVDSVTIKVTRERSTQDDCSSSCRSHQCGLYQSSSSSVTGYSNKVMSRISETILHLLCQILSHLGQGQDRDRVGEQWEVGQASEKLWKELAWHCFSCSESSDTFIHNSYLLHPGCQLCILMSSQSI